MTNRFSFLSLIFLLTYFVASTNHILGQEVDVHIDSGSNKSAAYTASGFIGPSPHIKSVNFDMVGEIYIIGENNLFHSFKGDDFRINKKRIIEPYDVSSSLGGLYDEIELGDIQIRKVTLNPLLHDENHYNKIHNSELLNEDLKKYTKQNELFTEDGNKKFTISGIVEQDNVFKDGFLGDKHRATLSFVTWTIRDNSTNSVLLEEKFAGGYYYSKNGKNETVAHFIDQTAYAYRRSVISSLVQFLKSSEVIAKKYSTNDSIQIIPSEAIILETGANFCSSLDNCIESTVTIKTKTGHGSGFFISSQGYLITNYHVIEEDSYPVIILSNGISLPAKIVRINNFKDVALLKVDAFGFIPIDISDPNSIKNGQNIFAVGTPKDISLGQSISKGIISAIRDGEPSLIQTDVSVNTGNSGGPLISEENKVIGIITSKLIGVGTEGVAFAIPVHDALDYLNIELTHK